MAANPTATTAKGKASRAAAPDTSEPAPELTAVELGRQRVLRRQAHVEDAIRRVNFGLPPHAPSCAGAAGEPCDCDPDGEARGG